MRARWARALRMFATCLRVFLLCLRVFLLSLSLSCTENFSPQWANKPVGCAFNFRIRASSPKRDLARASPSRECALAAAFSIMDARTCCTQVRARSARNTPRYNNKLLFFTYLRFSPSTKISLRLDVREHAHSRYAHNFTRENLNSSFYIIYINT